MTKSGVSLNWGGFDRALLGAAGRLSERKHLLDGVGEMLKSSTIQRFEDEEGPDGKAWKPSRRAGKTLTDTASLRNSIDYMASDTEVQVGSKIGSNVKYARIHQKGGKAGRGHKVTLPARPYLGASTQDTEDIQETLRDFIAGAFGGGR